MSRSLALAGVLVLVAAPAHAQTPAQAEPARPPLATRTGHDINLSVQHYNYTEPLGEQIDVKMTAPKAGAEYTGTFALSRRRLWFAQVNLRGTGFISNYNGSCRPWQIVPSSTSPNGYRLTLGATSPCSESGDADWYVEGRALAGKDFIQSTWALSPFFGIGARHLSNGTTGNFNFRTDEYLYVPLGTTVRNRSLAFTVEYDYLIRGWQKTRESLLQGGSVPATSTAPAFTIGDFEDLSFEQHHGSAFRASASYQVNRSWSIEPYYTRWRVGDSPVSDGSVAYTVNNITVRQTLSYYEPLNFTNEFGVKVGLHFGQK